MIEPTQERQQDPDEDEVRLLEPLLAKLSPEDWEDASHYDASPESQSR
ncbi:MAG: hypothetical protein HYS12_02720 [Planctomycetes bacterium]|nr:hypothetical protein [Planctomycetota bacterium]